MNVTPKADVKKYTTQELDIIITEALHAAREAADEQMKLNIKNYGHADSGSCGFAWVEILDLRANTKVAKHLYTLGMSDSWRSGVRQFWNPSSAPVQNVDTHEAGAEAFAKVLQSYNFKAYSSSRLD